MLSIVRLRSRETSDDETVIKIMMRYRMCAKCHITRLQFQPLQTVGFAAEVMDEGFIVEPEIQMRAPVADEFFEVLDQIGATRSQWLPAGLAHGGLVTFGFGEGVAQQFSSHFGLAEVEELHKTNVLEQCVVDGLGVVLAEQGADDFEFVKHLVDHQIEVVGLLEAAVTDFDGDLGVNLESVGAQALGQFVFVDSLVEQISELVLCGVSTAHHDVVDLSEGTVDDALKFEGAMDRHTKRVGRRMGAGE